MLTTITALIIATASAALPPCITEEASTINPPACVWNAEDAGNGTGYSFIDVNGTAYYPG